MAVDILINGGRPFYLGVAGHVGLTPKALTRDLTRLKEFRVTTPTRTALDLARFLDRPMAMAALDAFAHAGLTTVAELRRGLDALYRHPGVRQARQLVSYADARVECPGESWLRLRIIDAGFPRPEPQIRLYGSDGQEVYRLDMGYRTRRGAFEYDGAEFHDSREQRWADERRRKVIERAFGWSVWGFDRGDVLGRYPAVELAVGEISSQEPLLPRQW